MTDHTDTVHSLTSLPADDSNFKSALKDATDEQIGTALEVMRSRNKSDKTRMAACERELKRRTREREKGNK